MVPNDRQQVQEASLNPYWISALWPPDDGREPWAARVRMLAFSLCYGSNAAGGPEATTQW